MDYSLSIIASVAVVDRFTITIIGGMEMEIKGELREEHLDFFIEAMNAFDENERLETYTDKNEEYIALRYGMDRDCMKVFKLDGEVAFLHNLMNKARPLQLKEES